MPITNLLFLYKLTKVASIDYEPTSLYKLIKTALVYYEPTLLLLAIVVSTKKIEKSKKSKRSVDS